DPITGRFISEDPLGFGGGDVNLYVYAQNNPVNFVDPMGLWTIGVDISGSAGALLGFTEGVTFAIDDNLNVAAIPHAGGGVLVGASASGALQLQITNADTVSDLGGYSASIGGSLGGPIGATGEWIDGDGYSGINIGAYAGLGLLPVSMHRNVEYSWVYDQSLTSEQPCQ
ncbi:MAG TPA: RHS repeat-associated core domain-containing protein, partial [Desulfobacterales bacterium]|nr:RHS repeat-associated core domain-containing protein [Desulfobacterales bacterium]